MRRQMLALACGTVAGAACIRLFWLANFPGDLIDPVPWLRGTLALCAAGAIAACVTSIVSWKHTPGLPGMAFSLSPPAYQVLEPPGYGRAGWPYLAAVSLAVLVGLLAVYTSAWAADTYIVFRKLSVKPPPKQITPRIMLTSLLPACLLTAVVGVAIGFLVPITPMVIVPAGFVMGGLIASRIFSVRSTLWYSAAAPLGLTLFAAFMAMRSGEGTYPGLRAIHPAQYLPLAGLASAGAIAGHWLSLRPIRRRRGGG